MTVNREDYIKAIYELGGELKEVSNKNIAESLKISAPSVSEMIKKLLLEGYIDYEMYQGVRLTEYGVTEAMKIRRRHLLWEVFLVDKLGYSWEEIDEEAEKLEHVTSEKLEKLLDKYLGYPKFCPHGSPIIENGTQMDKGRTLELLSIGEEGLIKRITDTKRTLEYANKMNLKIGDKVKVIEIDIPTGMITCEKESDLIKIEKKIAEKIYIK